MPGQAHSIPLPASPPAAAIAARALRILAFTLAPLLLVPIVHNALDGGTASVAILVALEVAIGLALALNRGGRTRAGAAVFTTGAWLAVFGLATLGGDGTRDVVLLALAPILLAAGVLAGPRFLWSLAAATIVALIGLWWAEHAGWIAREGATAGDTATLLDAIVILLMTATATAVITSDLRRTLDAERLAIEALERSELRFRTAIELAADGILLADDAGRVTEANSRVCTLLGGTRGELIGRSIFDLLLSRECTADSSARERLDRGEVVMCERTLHAGTPGELILETSWQRLPDRSVQCFVRDITARRRLEDQLRHAQKMEAVGALAGGIAHDFNNLITVMRGFLELIEADPSLSGELVSHVGELRTASSHAAGLTQQLLAFAGRKPLERRAADVRDLLATNHRLIARLVGDTIKVVVDPLTTPCPVYVDPTLFAQVVLNLAANARDAMPSGGRITITPIAPEARTPPRLGPEGFVIRDYTGLRFADTGVGMEPETAARIFEPFFTTKSTGRNTGLGLAMVHGIVERHGGWVEVESAPGRGATFTLFLPVHAPPDTAAQGSHPAAKPHPAGTAATILVVDDDAGMRRLASHVLAHAGYAVVEAGEGPEALALWRDRGGAIDLLFTDMVMPGGMNGIQLIEACRERQPGVPAILTSGYTLPPLGTTPIGASGEVAMLAKPYANAVLVDTVRALLSARRRPAAR